MEKSSELENVKEPLELKPRSEFLLQLIRQNIETYPLRDRAIFELSYYSPISSQELVNLNASDIDTTGRAIRLIRGNVTVLIPITYRCAILLEEICSSINQGDAPLFLNSEGERISLSNLWFIKRNFSIEVN